LIHKGGVVVRGGPYLSQLVHVAVHGAVQHAAAEPAGERVARHAEHGVSTRVSDRGGEVGHADDEAVAAQDV
jgi:hypothetical protein